MPTPVMTTRNTVLSQKTETVTQASANDFDFEGLTDVGENYKEPELKTVTEVVDEAQPKNTQPKPMADGIHSGNVNVKAVNPATVDDFMSDSIVARPLRLPNYLDVRCKDPNWIPRWVNFKTQNGARYSMFKSAGFRNAKQEEMVGLSEEITIGGDGMIKDHDVVLMVAPKAIVFGAYKQNALNSMRMISRTGAMGRAKEESDRIIRQGISNEGFDPGQYGKKLTSYIPDGDEIGDIGGFKH